MKGAVIFNGALKSYFKANAGAYSRVTDMESKAKRQYNVKAAQREVLELALGASLLERKGVGGKKWLEKKGISSTTTFKLYPSGKETELELVYPKTDEAKKNELRLYFSVEQFSPRAGELILLFSRGNEVWIGSVSDTALKIIESSTRSLPVMSGRDESLESEIDQYQDIINDVAPNKQISVQSLAWKRDPALARKVLETKQFKCEVFPDHPWFVSKATGNPFMEVHHLVPMKHQSNFQINLDVSPNLCVLGPYAHRLIHHAEFDVIRPYLKRLSASRKPFLDSIGVTEGMLEDIYL